MFKEAIEAAKLIKNAFDTAEKLKDDIDRLKELGESNMKAMELAQIAINLQNLVFSLQRNLWTLETNHRRLEDKIRQYETFEVEKDKYAPHQCASGAVVYRPIQPIHDAEGNVIVHYLCANCYEQHKKSILQPGEIVDSHRTLRCHCCSSVVLYERIECLVETIGSRQAIDWSDY